MMTQGESETVSVESVAYALQRCNNGMPFNMDMTHKTIFMRGICLKEVKHLMEHFRDHQNKTYEYVRIKAVLLEKENAADQAERKMIVKPVKSELERTMMALSTQVQQLQHSITSKANLFESFDPIEAFDHHTRIRIIYFGNIKSK